MRDGGTGTPEPQPLSMTDEHGRGLLMVAALSASWGIEDAEDKTTRSSGPTSPSGYGGVHLRNGEHGYGAVTKLLHWLTVVAVVAQFVVGLDHVGRRQRQGQGSTSALERLEEQAEAQGEAAEERWDEEEKRLKEAPAPTRTTLVRRLCTSCSVSHHRARPAAPLGGARRRCRRGPSTSAPGSPRLQHWLEKLLLTMLIVTPGTGLLLMAGSGRPAGSACDRADRAAGADRGPCRAGAVLHTVFRRNRHLSRMV